MIDIKGLSKGAALAALYKHSKPQGLGLLHAMPGTISEEAATCYLTMCGYYVDYLNGRVIKTDFSGDEIDPFLYDRDLGEGAAARAINELRASIAAAGA